MPIVQPGELSRIVSRPFIARAYFALSSASKKITGGPWVASFDLAARYHTLRRSTAFSSVSVSLFTWKSPASSTLKRICKRSGGGGSTACVWSGSSGTRTAISFSSRGVSTMQMMRSTSTTSTSGVMLMSERTPLFAPMSIAMSSCSLRLRRRRPDGGGRGRGWLLVGAGVRQRLVEPAFLEEEVHQLVGGVGDVDRHLLHAIGQVVEHHQRGDGHEQAEGRSHQRLGDARRNRGETARAGGGHELEGGDDAEHGAQEAHEGSGRGDGRQAGQPPPEIRGHPQGGSFDGSVDRLDQVEFTHVVRPLVREGLAAAVVLGDAAAQHPRDVAVLQRVGHAGRLD